MFFSEQQGTGRALTQPGDVRQVGAIAIGDMHAQITAAAIQILRGENR
jgi:hypothetical protein